MLHVYNKVFASTTAGAPANPYDVHCEFIDVRRFPGQMNAAYYSPGTSEASTRK